MTFVSANCTSRIVINRPTKNLLAELAVILFTWASVTAVSGTTFPTAPLMTWLLISIPLAFYYNFTNLFLNDLGMQGVAGKQTLGQMSEVIFMILMPFFFVRLGVKKMLLVGMLAWVARYALFANGNLGPSVWMLYVGILLHGVCYDFFFVTGQIYTDRKASKDIRASAQGFIALITYGVGLGIGSAFGGNIVDAFTVNGVKDWKTIWYIPAAFAALVAVFFALMFRDSKSKAELAADARPAMEEA